MRYDNYLIPLLYRYLANSHVYPDKKGLQLILQSAPSFPSVLSVVQTCIYFGLDANGYRANYDALLKSEMPVIAHLKTNEGERFVLITRATEENVRYVDYSVGYHTIKETKEQFCTQWTRVLIVSDRGSMIDRKRGECKFAKYIMPCGLCILAILFAILLRFMQPSPSEASSFAIILFLLKGFGTWITSQLIRHEVSPYYSPFDQFCHLYKSFNCEEVLRSKASKLLNVIPLSDTGYIYFVTGLSTLVLSLLLERENEILPILFCLSVCCVPYTLFSALYQKFIVKKWCPLCLSVMGLILLEALLFLIYPPKDILHIEVLPTLLILSSSLIFAILTSSVYHRLLQDEEDVFVSKLENMRLKRNPIVLMTVFNVREHMKQFSAHSITIGNLRSDTMTITTLLNPKYIPCKEVATEVIRMMKKFPARFLWQIRFDGIEAEEYHPMNQVQLYLWELCRKETDDRIKLQIINDWFGRQSLLWLSKKYPINKISSDTIADFSTQCHENKLLDISKVPAIWVDGKALPKEYAISDLPILCIDKSFIPQSANRS